MAFFKKDRYFIHSPWWLRMFYSACIWKMPKNEKSIYLTFDDGPHPEITPYVLNELKKYNAKATFFCIGENVARYPNIYQQIIDAGHSVGNHTYKHLNGWKMNTKLYLNDIKEASKLINSNLFRPPFGRIKKEQIKALKIDSSKTKIIMWSFLAGDWDKNISPEKCYARIKNKISDGDIIVLHDSEKAKDRMYYCLVNILKDFSEKNFHFEAIHFS